MSSKTFFVFLICTLFIAPPLCNLSFYYKLAEVLGVARGILKIELKKNYLAYIIPKDTMSFLTKIQLI